MLKFKVQNYFELKTLLIPVCLVEFYSKLLVKNCLVLLFR
jgi:hypothetical protein